MISYIMPLFGADRLANAKAVLGTWEGKGQMLIASPEACLTHPGATVVQVPLAEDGWGKAPLMNVAAQVAQGDMLVFLDCDIPLPEGWHDRAEAWPHECYTGYTDFWRLTESQSNAAREMIAEGHKTIPFRTTEYYAHGGCGAGGIFCISKQLFGRIGPWKTLPCWGYEDVDYANRCRNTLGYFPHQRAMPDKVVHLWHPLSEKGDSEKNRELIEHA